MPVRAVEVDPRAEQEARRAHRKYARQNPSAARRFQLALDRAILQIAGAAELGSPYRGMFRWVQLRRFPYLLYYEVRDPRPVLVYAVAHEKRRPGYWMRRVQP